jgi:hypothetical protein
MPYQEARDRPGGRVRVRELTQVLRGSESFTLSSGQLGDGGDRFAGGEP